jgi:hypothetical protein
MDDQDKRAAFADLETLKKTTGLNTTQKDQHAKLVRELGGVAHPDGVYYICYENQQPCDPQHAPAGCTCEQMTY